MKIRSKSNSNRTMLTGHESLIRLIGKRRRFLPNRQSLLSDPIQLSSSLVKVENGAEDLSEERNDNLAGTSGSDKVTCPVCGNKVRGEEYMINSHLDACLTRGTKRKLSQQTLLQFNFSPRSKVQACLTKSDDTKSNITSDVKDITELIEVDTEETGSIIYESSSSSDNASLVNIDGSAKISVNDDTVNNGGIVNSPSLVSEIEASENESGDLDDDISGKILATFIVGRKFGDEGELHTETNITFCRDPENSKDPNAIKVLSAESGCNKVLGYIPRELAEHLSKLMDTFGLTFEGRIMSVPEHSHAAVPIQIWCQEKIPYSEIEGEKVKLYKSLCQQVLATVRLSEESPPGMKYQQNFCLLLQEVLRTTPHVFTHDEKTLLENFLLLSNDSQKLFIRLYTRKGPWFRMSNISYAEILDHQSAVNELSGGYVCSTETTSELHKDDFERILNLLNVGELREMLSLIKKKHSQSPRKHDSISALLSSYGDKSRSLLKKIMLEKTGLCIRISSAADLLIWRVERLFFCNGEQDLSAFLLVDLGIVKYPTYNCVITDHIFSNRNDLLSYEKALEVAQIMDESLEENNSSMVLKCIAISDSHISIQTSKNSSAPFQCFSASWVYSKVVLLGVSFLESERRYNDAVNLLKRLLLNFRNDRRRGYWTLRLSTDLEHLGRVNESLSVAETGLDDPWVRAGSKVSLQRRVLRLGKPPRRWKVPSFSDSIKRKIPEVHVEGRPLNCKTGTKSRFYGEDGEQCGVEELALQYYAGEEGGYWKGVHSESGIWLTVFGILMWDAIFADVANVFLTRFQTSPLDLETDCFYDSRKNIIESLLKKIQQGMGEEMLITSWELHFGTACRCVNWNRHLLTELRAVVSCIGGGCLASICGHLAQDYRSWSSGMPDLLLWRFHSDYSGEAKLVEVKGPRDRVSEQQRAWLLFFMDSGFNAEVCRVNPPVTNKVFV
ncbi:unnamed protein product [Lactuca saligna]|uniref:Fanconi-associated nuclease n=1 Tax=Lactuca saligna TaxID=75948 RepID=A0AA35Y624_LACSI|nr:unnamed protein product [Lactuca saligna]